MKPSEYTYSNANTVGGLSSDGDDYLGLLQIQLKLSLWDDFVLIPHT